jgi:protocatechuate 3,4-dioxygenase beta subunit
MSLATPPRDPAPAYEGRPLPDPTEPVYDQGLAFDVETLLDRRQVLKAMGYGGIAAGIFVVAGCTVGSTASPSAAASSSSPASATPGATPGATAGATAGATTAAECAVIPEETAGPFPGDGSNGPDVLTQSGVVRSDIRSSFGTSTNVAGGVPLTIKLAIQDIANGCAPLAGAAVYVWHCDREGRYSMYGQGVENENYLRGVQAAGNDGVVAFSSVFPGCYSGRWPHIHFEVYKSLADAADPKNKIATSQIALPKASCDAAYQTAGYEQSVQNLIRVSLTTDMVFRDDGGIHELGTVTGSVNDGLTVELAVPVSPA